MSSRTARDDCSGSPLVAGHATGVRNWSVDNLGRLTGLNYKQVWRPGENVARCGSAEVAGSKDGGPVNHELAAVNCGCGFWAYHDGAPRAGGSDSVVGVIEGYGKTTVGPLGFRSEKARIVAIAFPPPEVWKWRVRWDKWGKWYTPVAVIAGTAGAFAVGFFEPVMQWWILMLSVVVYLSGFGLVTLRNREVQRYAAGGRYSQPREVEARIRRNYPDVAFYPSVAAMLEAHPPDPQIAPSPDTDPNFWDDNDWTNLGATTTYLSGGYVSIPSAAMTNPAQWSITPPPGFMPPNV